MPEEPSVFLSTFEKACLDAYAAGYEAGFVTRDRLDLKFGRRRSRNYAFAVKAVYKAIRKMRASEDQTS